jgi:hypothetical protein
LEYAVYHRVSNELDMHDKCGNETDLEVLEGVLHIV